MADENGAPPLPRRVPGATVSPGTPVRVERPDIPEDLRQRVLTAIADELRRDEAIARCRAQKQGRTEKPGIPGEAQAAQAGTPPVADPQLAAALGQADLQAPARDPAASAPTVWSPVPRPPDLQAPARDPAASAPTVWSPVPRSPDSGGVGPDGLVPGSAFSGSVGPDGLVAGSAFSGSRGSPGPGSGPGGPYGPGCGPAGSAASAALAAASSRHERRPAAPGARAAGVPATLGAGAASRLGRPCRTAAQAHRIPRGQPPGPGWRRPCRGPRCRPYASCRRATAPALATGLRTARLRGSVRPAAGWCVPRARAAGRRAIGSGRAGKFWSGAGRWAL